MLDLLPLPSLVVPRSSLERGLVVYEHHEEHDVDDNEFLEDKYVLVARMMRRLRGMR